LPIVAGASLAARGAARLAYHFEGAAPPEFFASLAHPCRQYRNPIRLAQEWQGLLAAGNCAAWADLARQLGVTRARVTQDLDLLGLAPEVLDAVIGLGDPLPTPVVTERSLRPLLKLPAEEQSRVLRAACARQVG
jgi:hypothetical protein